MKIGIDARLYDSKDTGIGTYIKNLSDSLFELDQKNEYIIFFSNKIDWQNFSEKENVKKRLVSALPFSYKEQTIFLFNLLKENLDLIHFPNFNFPILYPKKFVCTIHDVISYFYQGQKRKSSKIHQLAFELTFKTALKKAQKIITVSNFSKKELVEKFFIDPEKIAVTYEGINKDLYPVKFASQLFNRVCPISSLYLHNESQNIQKKYGITKPFILFIGAWRKYKNLERLGLAFDILKEKYNLDYQLVIAGKEDLSLPEIKKNLLSIKSKKDLVLLDFISKEEKNLLYNASDLFVIPSLSEGFGLIGLEAMACGTPVVSSNATCLPEIYDQAALYFNPLDPEDMAFKITKVLKNKDLQQDLIEKGFQRINKFSWENCAKETLEIYKSVISTCLPTGRTSNQ